MTITFMEVPLYALALAVLVFTPGPVVVATIARTLASGWRTAMPLAAGVSIVDVLWPLLAILGLSALVQANTELLQWMRYIGGAILIWMGWRLIVGSKEMLETDPDPNLMRRNVEQVRKDADKEHDRFRIAQINQNPGGEPLPHGPLHQRRVRARRKRHLRSIDQAPPHPYQDRTAQVAHPLHQVRIRLHQRGQAQDGEQWPEHIDNRHPGSQWHSRPHPDVRVRAMVATTTGPGVRTRTASAKA